jgi:8-oxo-dGTP pyrophosphatase MutT (NUDIX family)
MNRGRWGFPKGLIDPGHTLEEAAAIESWEEAGLRGRVIGSPLGSYDDFKWGKMLLVTGVLLAVESWTDDWPESEQRKRMFCDARETGRRLARAAQQRLLAEALLQLDGA